MEIAASNIKMKMMDSRLLEAFGPLSNEVDSFNSSVFTNQGQNTTVTFNVIDQRRKLASELLEVLESAQTDLDEPYSGWLEEPMDLEVFGQSLEQSSMIPLDEVQASYQSSDISSPLVWHPPTPLAPTSPQELYTAQDDNKFEEAVLAVPDNGDLLESLESLLYQFESNASATTSSSVSSPEPTEADNIDAALLDSLISDNVEPSQLLDELAEISLALMQTSEQSQTPEPQSLELPSVVPSLCFDSDSSSTASEDTAVESAPPRRRGRKPQTPVDPLRKTRKRATKPEDKRLRKKEQNKTAATRYRMKKKAELDLLLEEEEKLEQRNRELQSTYDDLASEVHYLKKLFREILGRR